MCNFNSIVPMTCLVTAMKHRAGIIHALHWCFLNALVVATLNCNRRVGSKLGSSFTFHHNMHNIWKEFLPVMLKLESCLLPFANFLANFAFAEFWPTVFLAATIHIWRKEECWYFLSDWLWPTYAIQDNLGPPTTATHHSLHHQTQTDSSN